MSKNGFMKRTNKECKRSYWRRTTLVIFFSKIPCCDKSGEKLSLTKRAMQKRMTVNVV